MHGKLKNAVDKLAIERSDAKPRLSLNIVHMQHQILYYSFKASSQLLDAARGLDRMPVFAHESP